MNLYGAKKNKKVPAITIQTFYFWIAQDLGFKN
jgi:hypothetical protein